PPSFPPLRTLLSVAETLLIATAGGAAFALIGFPAGLVAGSMLAVAVAALVGRPMQVPLALAWVCFVLVGILLGAVVTPETLAGIAAWPGSIAILALAVIVMLAATACYLRFVHGWAPLSRVLGATPASGARGASLAGLALLVTGSTAVALGLARMRFPGGLLFGAMAGSGLLHGTGLVQASLPWWAGSAAVVTLGAVAGARFANTSPRMMLDYLGAAFGSFAVAFAVASSFALLVVALLPFRVADVIVAFAPGAQDTMMVLALALPPDR